LLELFMDLGASVAFVSEPAAPATMTRPPRDPAARFLDRPELAAIALTAAALSTATLPAYLAVRSMADADASRAAAIAAWLITHATVAWALRARPGLALARNPAFPLWALVAALTALVIALTPLSTVLGVASLGAHTLAIVIASSVAGAAVAAVGQRALGLRGGL
jgi:Ca2+-transporting ATPase